MAMEFETEADVWAWFSEFAPKQVSSDHAVCYGGYEVTRPDGTVIPAVI